MICASYRRVFRTQWMPLIEKTRSCGRILRLLWSKWRHSARGWEGVPPTDYSGRVEQARMTCANYKRIFTMQPVSLREKTRSSGRNSRSRWNRWPSIFEERGMRLRDGEGAPPTNEKERVAQARVACIG